VDAYFGDVNGDHHLNGVVKALFANLASTANSGFTAFTLLHPAIIGDVSGDNAVTANSGYMAYDPAVQSVSAPDITLGSRPSQGTGWQLSATVNAATGQISIQLYSQTPITIDQAGSVVNIAFHAKASAGLVGTTVQLLDSKTILADAQAAMILSPGLDCTSALTSNWVQSLI
jgi:hypothetical protein